MVTPFEPQDCDTCKLTNINQLCCLFFFLCIIDTKIGNACKAWMLRCSSDLPCTDAVMELFFKTALDDFLVGRLQESDLHPDYCSLRVAVYVLVRKPETR